MKTVIVLICGLVVFSLSAPVFRDGVLIEMQDQQIPVARQLLVIDSFPAGATNYSIGLACDGEYLWNDEAFLHWFARMDTATGAVLNTFSPTIGNRDMTFDGQYLWASDWQSGSINKFDTATCTVVNTYNPPFYAGKPNGMAWDSTHLWVGEESGRIYQMTLTGDTVRSIPPPVYYSYDPRGLAFDGTNLWVGYQSSGLIYKVDPVNGAILNTYSAPGAVPGQRYQQGLAFDGQFLWSTVGGATQMIYKSDIGLTNIKEHVDRIDNTLGFAVNRNPFVNRVMLYVSITEPTDADISIIDAGGRVVDVVHTGILTPGTHTFSWDSDDSQAGVYFALLRTERSQTTLKLLKLQK